MQQRSVLVGAVRSDSGITCKARHDHDYDGRGAFLQNDPP